MDALATTDELQAKLSWTMSTDELREASGALDELSDQARYYGSDGWAEAASTPRSVKNLVLAAAKRHMRNYEGYVSSRAGDESVTWTDMGDEAGTASFNKREITMLRQIGGAGGGAFVGTVNTFAYGSRPRAPKVIYVRSGGNELGGDPDFPYYAGDDPFGPGVTP